MTHFVICENAACHFVLDISIRDRQAARRQSIFSACPECGSNFSSTCPFSGRVLLVQWSGGLPHCACCHRKLQPNPNAHTPPPVPTPIANAAKHR